MIQPGSRTPSHWPSLRTEAAGLFFAWGVWGAALFLASVALDLCHLRELLSQLLQDIRKLSCHRHNGVPILLPMFHAGDDQIAILMNSQPFKGFLHQFFHDEFLARAQHPASASVAARGLRWGLNWLEPWNRQLIGEKELPDRGVDVRFRNLGEPRPTLETQ